MPVPSTDKWGGLGKAMVNYPVKNINKNPRIPYGKFSKSLPISDGSMKRPVTTRKISKAFDCVEHDKLWVVLLDLGSPIHLIKLIRLLYTNQEATLQTHFMVKQIGSGSTRAWCDDRGKNHQQSEICG